MLLAQLTWPGRSGKALAPRSVGSWPNNSAQPAKRDQSGNTVARSSWLRTHLRIGCVGWSLGLAYARSWRRSVRGRRSARQSIRQRLSHRSVSVLSLAGPPAEIVKAGRVDRISGCDGTRVRVRSGSAAIGLRRAGGSSRCRIGAGRRWTNEMQQDSDGLRGTWSKTCGAVTRHTPGVRALHGQNAVSTRREMEYPQVSGYFGGLGSAHCKPPILVPLS